MQDALMYQVTFPYRNLVSVNVSDLILLWGNDARLLYVTLLWGNDARWVLCVFNPLVLLNVILQCKFSSFQGGD